MSQDVYFIDLGKERYCYRMWGSGREIVLLHGWTDSGGSYWHDIVEYFAKEYKIIALDTKGHGCSAKPKQGYTLEDHMDILSQFMSKLELKKPILLGHSLGGLIASKYAVNHSKKIRALIVMDGPFGAGFLKNLRREPYPPLLGAILFGLLAIPVAGRIVFNLRSPVTFRTILKSLHAFYDVANMSSEFIEEKMKCSYEATMQTLFAISTNDLESDLGQIKVPTLFLHGEFDRLVPKAIPERAVKQISGAQLMFIPKAGHFPMMEEPDLCNKLISGFLQKL